jgi:Glycine rich protein
MLALAGSAAAAPSCSTTVGVTTCTFSYSGAQESWVAPTGVTSITVDAYGASGMQLTAPSGRTNGLGAHVQATLAVTPGSTYYVTVGGAGGYGVGGGGFNGGGDGGTFDFSGFGLGSLGGGGGGATDFRTSSALSDRVVVAGGGGGDSWPTLGGNSGSDGNNGVCSLESSNDGGTCVANAVGGKAGTSGGAVGGTGESVDGITGADAPNVAAGSATGGVGASWPAPFDANTFLFQFGGGGGGGGYYGGSGGGAGMLVDISGLNGSDGGGGGGGGSDYVDPSATNVTVTDGGNVSSGSSTQTDGSLTITYNEPPPACTATGFFRDGINLTAKQIGGSVTGTLDASGCNIGVYYGPGTTGTVSGTITGSNYYGVVADRAAVNVTGATVHDIGETQPNGAQHGVGVLYTTIELTSDPSNAHFTVGGHASGTLSGTSITRYQKNGVVISGSGAAATVKSNTVTGYGMIDYIAQNGIEVASGATASVTGNTISGNWYTPKNFVACGLLFFQSGGVKQSGNNLFNNEVNLCNAGRGGGNYKP